MSRCKVPKDSRLGHCRAFLSGFCGGTDDRVAGLVYIAAVAARMNQPINVPPLRERAAMKRLNICVARPGRLNRVCAVIARANRKLASPRRLPIPHDRAIGPH